MRNLLIGFCVGWFFGAAVMWYHFLRNQLIRTKEEWLKATGGSHDH